MRECNASYKMGIKFVNWRTGGRGAPDPRPFGEGTDHYRHLFCLPRRKARHGPGWLPGLMDIDAQVQCWPFSGFYGPRANALFAPANVPLNSAVGMFTVVMGRPCAN